MEAVVAEGLSPGLLPPAGKARGQGLPLVGAGEVDDGGGAPPEGRPTARGKAVGGDGARHLQIKVGVGIDEAGEEDAAAHVDDPVRLRPEAPAQGDHLLPLHQQVRPPDAPAGNHAAALEQCAHMVSLRSFYLCGWDQYTRSGGSFQLPRSGLRQRSLPGRFRRSGGGGKIFPLSGNFALSIWKKCGIMTAGSAEQSAPKEEEVKECRPRSSCPCCWLWP